MKPPPGLRLPPLGGDATARLAALVELVASDAGAPTSVRDAGEIWRAHVADSLSGLEWRPLAEASAIADLGAGAGFPGLPLAAVLPRVAVDLVESAGRKCEFMRRAGEAAGIANARVVCDRAESWALEQGAERYEAVTARALADLAALVELASPLLRQGGHLVAWKGARDGAEETAGARAGARVGMEPVTVLSVQPYEGSRNRHLHVYRKSAPTPEGVPRRPGRAQKRPFGVE